jgi:multidrug efflux pump subunit AcrA (membrane-fusion protein)
MMNRRQVLAALLALMTVGLLVGCGGAGGTAEPTAEAEAVAQDTEGKVIAEAVVEPARWSDLRFTIGGTVVQVSVEPGDQVAAGDLLVELDRTDLALAVQEAEAAVASAQAQLAQVKAGPRPEEIAAAEHQLADAVAALSRATAQRDQLAAGTTAAEIAAAQAEVAQAQAEQRAVEETHRKAYKDKDEDTRKIADYQLHAAREAVAAAQAKLEAAQGGAGARIRDAGAGVSAASAQRDVAQAELDLLKAGVTPEEVAVSEAAVRQAEVTVATAEDALGRTEIRAPFAGVVTKVNVEAGETAAPGDVVVVLAGLDRLQARTIDLTELDVARVAEGQPVVVTVDALPGVELRGHVARIGQRSEDYRGDVVYPVIVELDEDAPGLRWGMTAVVEIETD